ncbi:filamentous hemagglutinin N-terminal domain-containing protein [Myxosarcina sp. GI1]|uniref:two-partner secretion domain-containing protein n=1 Tax=Myxosarcina sp. GI1 TaxID=1541065 RepID=UPI00056D2651|nr:filamentous hemagglutinin N-terminal domain-containing protein [Myxosarcina sp. GI1]
MTYFPCSFIKSQQLKIATVLSSCAIATPAIAQITPDGTIPTEVDRTNDVWEITGGERVGDNLFHSFQEFSLPTDNTAFFNNATDVVNAISRVTGGSISEIDGLIRANGNANLILINPAGINFGANARLDIGGSFLGSTAESLIFEDGTVFSATDTQNTLLTVSVPLGLQMGQSSGAIGVEGIGNQITETDLASPLDILENPGLQVQSERTLALVGKGLIFDGGTVTARGGDIELGSVAQGTVNLDPGAMGWNLSYENVAAFADLQLRSQALADASSTGSNSGGSIQVRGSQVSLTDGSSLLIQNTAETAAGAIDVGASESLMLQGFNSSQNGSNIVNESLAGGNGGNINIATSNLSISDRAFISTTAYGAGAGGDLNIASDAVTINGTGIGDLIQNFQVAVLEKTFQPSDRGTGLFIGSVETGTSGNVNINTGSLRLDNGSIIHSPTFTTGKGGDINISANNIELVSSALQAGAVQDSVAGNTAGDIDIDTASLDIRDGAVLLDITLGAAAAGDIKIDASQTVTLQNSPEGAALLTGIYANSSVGSGAAGNIEIVTDRLNINDAFVTNNSGLVLLDESVINTGGTGGNINIEANEIDISGIPYNTKFSSGIGSSTFSDSDAGNINITTERLTVRDGGDITTATLGSGNGGDLTINASEFIDVGGTLNIGTTRRGGLFAASGRAIFPDLDATGAAGAINITTPDLTIRDGASIDVQSIGEGGTGELSIVANEIVIDNQSEITAATETGVGGNIFLEADNVFWRRQSTTTASAGGSGNGGNITIQADNLVALEGSELIANATEGGDGGNILVDTESLFICPSCVVDASASPGGVDGIITFSVLEPEPNLETINLPEQPAQAEEAVALACSSERDARSSELTITGRGGLPPRPSEPLSGESAIAFTPDDSEASNADDTDEKTNTSQLPPAARDWYVNPDGVVVLAAQSPDTVNSSPLNSPDCHVR